MYGVRHSHSLFNSFYYNKIIISVLTSRDNGLLDSKRENTRAKTVRGMDCFRTFI